MASSMMLAILGITSTLSSQVAALTRRGYSGATPKYYGGGDPVPTADPAGQLWPPSCTCPMPMPAGMFGRGRFTGNAPLATPAPGATTTTTPYGQVEVLTVDLHLANKVRCDNSSLAVDVAQYLGIPVKRVTVTPDSWSLPSPSQSRSYLAFLQEDHERCDCQNENGKVEVGQGFRKVYAGGETNGVMLGPDTSVMTVSQYRAMQAGNSPSSNAGSSPSSAGSPAPAAAGTTRRPPEPPSPASRVQMMTRDPCLVQLLREMTPQFQEEIAFFIGVPADKIILDPPAVKGTVGLLQLDSSVHSESEDRQTPVVALQHCSLTERSELQQRLALLSVSGPSPAPAPAPLAAPMTAPMFTVAAPNASNTTNGTNVTSTQHVNLVMKLEYVNYELLSASPQLVSSFTSMVKAAIGEAGHVPPAGVKVSIWPGSTVVQAQITPPPGTAVEAVFAFLNGTVCNATVDRLGGLTELQKVTSGGLTSSDCSVLSMEVEDTPVEPEEKNRAWIAFWSLSILPPFAQDGAWRLLKMVNEPGSRLSELLPMTLARIPGLKYRGLLEPNLAIKDANETRLPPPEDKAVGFALPEPYDLDEKLKDEQRRMKRENAESALRIKSKDDLEQAEAGRALRNALRERAAINQTQITIFNAARAHASALRSPDAVPPVDIVEPEVLKDYHLASESPYPWRDQMPPPRYMTSLAQESQGRQFRQQRSQRLLSQHHAAA